MSNIEPNTQLPPPSPNSLPIIGLPIPGVRTNREQFLGASNAHVSPIRIAEKKANVDAGYNPGGYGRLPGVEAPKFVPETTAGVEAADGEPDLFVNGSDNPMGVVPEDLSVASENRGVPPVPSNEITSK